MYLELTGALTAGRNLIVPANKKLYFIYNNTTGGYAVTVKTSGTGIAVPMGKKCLLVCDGTNVVEATNHTVGAASFGGAVNISGAATALTHIPNFATTTSSAGNLILSVSSSQVQEITGSTTHTVTLPVTSTLVKGQGFTVINSSTGAVTVNSSGGNQVVVISPGNTVVITCIGLVLTTAVDWSVAATSAGQMLGNAANKAIFWNAQTINENITVGATQNAMSVGPVTVGGGFAVTVTAGGRWVTI